MPAALFDALLGFTQGIGQALQNGAVQVGARVHIAKSDHRALGFGPGDLDAGIPEGLQHQALRARRHAVDQGVEQAFWRDALLLRKLLLVQTKLLLEPAHHPEAARDLDLGAVVIRHGGLVGRDEARDFQVAFGGGVDGGGRTIRKAGDLRCQAACAYHFTGFVGGASNHRQALRQTTVLRCLGADCSDDGASGYQFGQHGGLDTHDLPLPVEPADPTTLLVIKGDVANLRSDGIDHTTGKAVIQVAREQKKFVGFGPDFGLLFGDPVAFGFVLKEVDRLQHADGPKSRFPPPRQFWDIFSAALIQPNDGGAQRLALLVEHDGGGALRGDDHAGDGTLGHRGLGPQLLTGLTQALPEGLGVVLQPTGLRRLVAVDSYLGLVDQIALQVKQQGAYALGAVVNGQQVGFAHSAWVVKLRP